MQLKQQGCHPTAAATASPQTAPSVNQALPLSGHLHIADQPPDPYNLPPEEEQAAVLIAEVGIEGLKGRDRLSKGPPASSPAPTTLGGTVTQGGGSSHASSGAVHRAVSELPLLCSQASLGHSGFHCLHQL